MESKPKRKYTKKEKRPMVADDEQKTSRKHYLMLSRKKAKRGPPKPSCWLGIPPPGWDPDWNADKEKKANEEHEQRWKQYISGLKRSGPEEIKPDMTTTRYFKITKTIEEIDQSEVPSINKEHSELLPKPVLERSETIGVNAPIAE